MASRTCWKCGNRAVMVLQGHYVGRMDRSQRYGVSLFAAALFSCPECEFPSVGLASLDTDHPSEVESIIRGEQQLWLPEKALGKEFPDVPHHIGDAAGEAYECLSVDAYRAAVLLARAVIEATCKDKGIVKGRLVEKIDSLCRAGHIRAGTAGMAHEIRHLGNELAHGDFVEPVDREDCEEICGLMTEVLNEVYQNPARLERRKEARLAKTLRQAD